MAPKKEIPRKGKPSNGRTGLARDSDGDAPATSAAPELGALLIRLSRQESWADVWSRYGTTIFMAPRPVLDGKDTKAQIGIALDRIESWCRWARLAPARANDHGIAQQAFEMSDVIDKVRKPHRPSDLRNMVTAFVLTRSAQIGSPSDPDIRKVFAAAVRYARKLSPDLAKKLAAAKVEVCGALQLVPSDRRKVVGVLRRALDDLPKPITTGQLANYLRDYDKWLENRGAHKHSK